ncbi:unnamed protein product [Caenorhabditis sp. 36 PRJEB53466]|nr:unnamed protein product [Caenorhabditis sp. 36 PRJEB53466]
MDVPNDGQPELRKIFYETIVKEPIEIYGMYLTDVVEAPTSLQAAAYKICNEENKEFFLAVGASLTKEASYMFNAANSHEDRFERFFIKEGTDTLIYYYDENRNRMCYRLENTDYRDAGASFANYLLTQCDYQIKELKLEMLENPIQFCLGRTLPVCRKFETTDSRETLLKWWLPKFPEQMEFVNFDDGVIDGIDEIVGTEIINLPQIMNAEYLRLEKKNEFGDEQLLACRIKDLSLDWGRVTESGINTFLTKWVYGDGVEGFKHASFGYPSEEMWHLFDGLEIKLWNEEFNTETDGFCERFLNFYKRKRPLAYNDFYQLLSKNDPFESLTVALNDSFIVVSATGKRVETEDGVLTRYSIPDNPYFYN